MRIGCHVGMWKGSAPLAEKIAAIGKTGVAGVELFAEDLKPFLADPTPLRAMVERAALELTGAYLNPKEFLDPAAERAVMDEAAAVCRCLHSLGSEYLVINGGPSKGAPPRTFTDADFRRLAAVLNRIGESAAQFDVDVVLHPHWKCQVESPADVDRLVAAGLDWGKVGLCPHAVHQALINADPYAIGEKYASRVRYVHLGDCDRAKKAAFLGKGVIDQGRFMKPLLAAGYDGWLVLEGAAEGATPAVYTSRALAYLHNAFPAVAWED